MKYGTLVHRCIICNEPTSTKLVIEDDENELELWLCQAHGFDMMQVRVHV